MINFVNISESFSLGLHGLIYLALNSERGVKIKELADKLDASRGTLASVFQRVTKAGITVSFRGPHGGLMLKKDPDKITFLEIYKVIEGETEISGCPLNRNKCIFSECIFSDILTKASTIVYNNFKDLKLSDFVQKESK